MRSGQGRAASAAWFGAAILAVVLAIPGSAAAKEPGAGVRRIVSLAPSVTEILFALGAGDRVVAVSSTCDRPSEVARLPRVGTWVAPNVESILALSPDLVLAVPSPGNRDAVLRLRDLGLRVEVVGESTLADAWDAMLRIGEWTGREAQARDLVERLRRELDLVRASVAGRKPRRTLFVVGHEPLVAAGPGLFVDEILRLAGGENVAASTGRPWPRLSIESVVAMSPEVVVDAAMGSEAGDPTSWWSKWASIAAVHDRRVRSSTSDALLRPGPRLGEAAREMRRLLWDDPPSEAAR